MITFDGDVREGMEVMGLDGESLGTIGAVRAEGETEVRHDLAKGMPPPGIGRGDGYFHLCDGADDLRVPFDAIIILFPGQTITLGYTADECRERYRHTVAS